MHLSELRSLPVGAPLLAGPSAEPVVFVGITPAGSGRRIATARALTWDGREREVQPRQLRPAPPTACPDAVMVRPELEGRTVTIERITAHIWPRIGIASRGVIRQPAVIRRHDGHFRKVCCVQTDLWGGGDLETAAKAYADEGGARYIPAGSV
ncbi:hypothetical protein [Spirillospora sp. CA-128828]|uniref:hypothetical protein n=1 Tax=Spirillospora sp. CA-128828 TaxID=3240033 RepID=UPI003D8C95AB